MFAHLKRILKLDRLRLRGMSGATDEFTLAAAVQNLRLLGKLSSQGPPTTGQVRPQSTKTLKLTH
ncbi:ISPsy22, transposase [Pseudomonas syringae pv. actinidiae]|uniref:ISPsy22, transposase n=1 Tax=Pseudomonas syringae pv. actinidiae TaxID=103796 RepID=A0A7Z6UFE1_PSESF|nr:ISPsy22, transposase [Pseudomonas syringae pv. actinidiae]